MNSIKLTKKQAAPIINATFPEYTGRKYNLNFQDEITFYDTNWGGGSKNEYAFIASDGKTAQLNVPAPWINVYEGATIQIPNNVMVVVHSYFCGQDMGIRIYANTMHAPKWLTA
jgi:hypothetical protein